MWDTTLPSVGTHYGEFVTDHPDYIVKNQTLWDEDASSWVAMGERAWAILEPNDWGIWHVPESELKLIPDDMTGMRAIELGCGTAYVSAWMARRGARVAGIDLSEKQLETARRLAFEHEVEIELIHGNAEDVPYPDSSFDFAISEYGAAIWADPYKWIPEAHRLLVSGGDLVFLGNHPFLHLVVPRDEAEVTDRTLRYPYFGMHRINWEEPDGEAGTEFNLPISEWMSLFDDVGFDVVRFVEIRNPDPNQEKAFGQDPEWARDFPSEQVWKLRKR
jgi:SAM-dependent methyltransferase